jgi:predicted dehydrogenase
MTGSPLRVALVGCGDISQRYGQTLVGHEEIDICGATDLVRERAESWTASFGGKVYDSLDEVLRDDGVDAVINLTIHQAHKEVIERSLEANKHVFSEKPLTIDPKEAFALAELAEAKGLRLGCAPVGFLGEAQQTAWKAIRDGAVGRVRLVYAEVNWGRPELTHGNPKPFYEVGPVFDVGVYPLTILTTVFGPARRVVAVGRVLLTERRTLDGDVFEPKAPDFALALVEFADGTVARLTVNFYVSFFSRQQGAIEFHGDEGSLYLGSWFLFDAKVERARFGERYAPLELVRDPYPGCEWSRGIVEMADAMRAGRPHRVTGRHAAHVVEIMSSIHASARDERPVEIGSSFTPPEPMDWAT